MENLIRPLSSDTKIIRMSWDWTKAILKLVAIWPEPNIIYYYIIFSNALYQMTAMTVQCYLKYVDFITVSKTIGPMMGLYISFGKICLYRYQSDSVVKINNKVENCIANEKSEVYKYFKIYSKTSSIICVILQCNCIIICIGYLILPLFSSAISIPFDNYYPWNYEDSRVFFIISYAHESIVALLMINANGTEYTFVWAICYCCARLRIIQKKLRMLSIEKITNGNEDKFHKSLISAIRMHTDVYEDIELINKSYTYIVILIFFAAVVAICCTCIQMTAAKSNQGSLILFLLLAIYYAGQLLLYYLPGEIIASEMAAVGFAIYNCGWEYRDIKYRKSIHLAILKCNAPVRLLAGNLVPLRLENYATFLATTGSYFTSMHSVTSN